MNRPYKPSGYSSLSPYFVVKGAQQLIDFLIKLFNAKELRRFNNQDGSIMHVEIQIDDSVIMIGEALENLRKSHSYLCA